MFPSLTSPSGSPLHHSLMPAPARFRPAEGRLAIDEGFSFHLAGHEDTRLRQAVARALRRWEARTGLTFPFVAATDAASAKLVVACERPGAAIPELGEDESHQLTVSPERATLRAPTVVGAMHGLETLLQLLQADADGFFVPAVRIDDAPRFPWRGLMLDVGRHWMPAEVIQRTLDCMAVVKLNVLHLHLSEDQGFRIESKTHPRLHELGSDGDHLTQEQVRAIIAYATERGIRVVPEFDIPGHASSWLVGYPELGSLPGPYAIVRRWGICSGVLDPTNEAVYRMLDDFLGEMAALFPDRYLHIGGDEVPHAESWDRVPHIRDFIREERLGDHAGLQARFNQRVLRMLEKHGKRMVGWDEILHPDLPKQSVVHSWRGPEGLGAAARAGHPVILSNGYYIDLGHPACRHYLNDPLPADTPLNPEEQARILGGEATMWSEWVTAETVDSRVWPRTAAIAERLWSARDVRDVDDMYRRLDAVSRRLEEAGSLHEANVAPMIRRFAGDTATPEELAALQTLAGLVEPVQEYRRGVQQPQANSLTLLTGLADITRPDSRTARTFAVDVGHALFTAPPGVGLEALAEATTNWLGAVAVLRHRLAARAPRVRALVPLLERSALALETGRDALAHLRESEQPAEAWCAARLEALTQAAEPHDACRLPFVSSLRLLVAAAALTAGRATMPATEWRRQVEDLAAEERKQPAATMSST